MQDKTEIPDNTGDIFNVTRLNREVRAVLEGSFPTVWVEGEISNLALPGSGHIYFTLKDAASQVRCAMFRGRNRTLGFNPENGIKVLVHANISLYEARGEFQLIIDHMEPAGEGALQRAYEELKQKLFRQGLFDETHKLPIPVIPECIGIITSPTGAAIRDILTVLKRRYPTGRIILYPTPVQGNEAHEQIISMIETAGKRQECDVLILARGGGSLEDLWAFNHEQLAHAIYQCEIPIVSGIGHEIDFTIADFVADMRAATPSAAAELVSPDQHQLRYRYTQQLAILHRQLANLISDGKRTVAYLEKRIPHPLRTIQMVSQRVDDMHIRMVRALAATLNHKKILLSQFSALLERENPRTLIKQHQAQYQRLHSGLIRGINTFLRLQQNRMKQAAHNINTVSPLATLGRGYAIVQQQDGKIVRHADQLHTGETVEARFVEGSAELKVHGIKAAGTT